MKKQIKNISLFALLFTMSTIITSCQSKTDKFLDKYENITKTLEDKVKKGEKVSSLADMTDIAADLAIFSDEKEMKAMEENMDGEQKARLVKITARYADAILKLQGIDTSKIMNHLQNEATKDIENASADALKEMEDAMKEIEKAVE